MVLPRTTQQHLEGSNLHWLNESMYLWQCAHMFVFLASESVQKPRTQRCSIWASLCCGMHQCIAIWLSYIDVPYSPGISLSRMTRPSCCKMKLVIVLAPGVTAWYKLQHCLIHLACSDLSQAQDCTWEQSAFCITACHLNKLWLMYRGRPTGTIVQDYTCMSLVRIISNRWMFHWAACAICASVVFANTLLSVLLFGHVYAYVASLRIKICCFQVRGSSLHIQLAS